MNLFYLPCDIKYYINQQFLDTNKIRLLNTCGFYNKAQETIIKENIKISKNKILLYFLIKHKQMKLFRKIKETLDYHFINHLGGMISFNDSCLMYAPHVQYGPCRFCMKNLDQHKYNKMINLYLKLTTQNEQ